MNVLVLLILFAGCGKSLPVLDGINLTDWKNDKNGCNGIRQSMTELIIAQKDKLLSLSETDIIRLLGKPDETELSKRNEKFYRYYLRQGVGCSQNPLGTEVMIIRFNAIGFSKEVVVE